MAKRTKRVTAYVTSAEKKKIAAEAKKRGVSQSAVLGECGAGRPKPKPKPKRAVKRKAAPKAKPAAKPKVKPAAKPKVKPAKRKPAAPRTLGRAVRQYMDKWQIDAVERASGPTAEELKRSPRLLQKHKDLYSSKSDLFSKSVKSVTLNGTLYAFHHTRFGTVKVAKIQNQELKWDYTIGAEAGDTIGQVVKRAERKAKDAADARARRAKAKEEERKKTPQSKNRLTNRDYHDMGKPTWWMRDLDREQWVDIPKTRGDDYLLIPQDLKPGRYRIGTGKGKDGIRQTFTVK